MSKLASSWPSGCGRCYCVVVVPAGTVVGESGSWIFLLRSMSLSMLCNKTYFASFYLKDLTRSNLVVLLGFEHVRALTSFFRTISRRIPAILVLVEFFVRRKAVTNFSSNFSSTKNCTYEFSHYYSYVEFLVEFTSRSA